MQNPTFYPMPASALEAKSASAKAKPTKQKAPAKPLGDKFAKLGLRSEMDFVLHLPMRYEDETEIVAMRDAAMRGGSSAQIEGIITDCEIQYRPRRQLVVTIADETAQVVLRFLNFYGSQTKQMAVGNRVRARGEVRHGFFGAEMVHPHYKMVIEGAPLPNALTPVYHAGDGVSQTLLRKAIKLALDKQAWHDTLSAARLNKLKLMGFEEAVKYLHNPPPDADQHSLLSRHHPAWQRMKFDELLAQQLSLKRAQAARRAKGATALSVVGELCNAFMMSLPFVLTNAQERVLAEIRRDLKQNYPMQRLLQGDVGSGKTIVAALAAAQAIDSGFQAALMAPTEILADQHFRKIAAWLAPLGITTAWLTGSLKAKEKREAQALIASGEAQLVIGTHALIQDAVQFAKLGLVIVDEQHRFGVAQRLSLRNKGGSNNSGGNFLHNAQGHIPHQLMMSATPIPRTLAMTYYADLEVSVIDELPPGRTPIVTRVVDQTRREEVIERVHAAALEGKQVYWVCPLIEESEALQLQTATDTHAMLSAALPDLRVGLVHGRLKPAEKQAVMGAFTENQLQVLVATTVIEVGVDVPNASLMVIEHAERFGLSQLHQLRGRVGRGAAASVCLLLYQGPLGGTAKERLRTMRESNDGFAIARKDLQLRGPGEFLGARQSGEAMLRFADLDSDQDLVEQARQLASELLANDPATVDAHLQRWMGHREEFLRV